MPRYPIPGAPSMGGGTVSPYRQGDNIADLIYASGAGRANAALAQGDIWGNTIAGIGQNIGNYIGQREQSKQMAKRDAFWVDYVENGDWHTDPKKAYAMALRTWGPEEGPKQFKALEAAGHLAGDKRDPEKDAKSLGVIVGAMGKLQDPARARLYPQAYKLAKGVYPDLEVSPEYDPEKWPELEAIGAQLRGEKPPEMKTATVPGPNGQPMLKSLTPEELAAGVPTYEAPKRQVVTVAGPNGQPMAKMVDEAQLEAGVPTYREPKQPSEGRLVQVMGPNGTPIWVREGDAVGKPAAQAPRAVTGAERQSLAFFNRGKQAIEDIAPIEEKVTESGFARQAQLQYAPNVLQSDEQQKYRQAQRAFTEARLRKESGAAIPESEFKNDAKTYFGQPGDSKAVLEQKRNARAKVLEGLGYSAGKAYEEFYGEPLALPGSARTAKPIPPPAAGAPKVGDTKKFSNGKVGRWDGKGWVAQ